MGAKKTSLLALGVLVLAIGGFVLQRAGGSGPSLAVPGGGAGTGTDRAADAVGADSAASETPAELAAERRSDTERTAAPIAAEPARTHPFGGTGSIALLVVDAATRAPLPDLPVVVWSEQPRPHVFRCAATDAEGRLLVERLPEDVVLFETPRRAPHANTIAATRLAAGQHRSFTLEVGGGGTVKGRVVDDLGQPLAGVEVGVDPRPGGATLAIDVELQWREPHSPLAARCRRPFEAATTTDREGRYEFGALRSRPGAFGSEPDGSTAPKREDGVAVIGRFGQATRSVMTTVADGATVELPDLVFQRTRTFAGRVVEDGSGAPIAGALVTAQGSRFRFLSERAFDRPWVPRMLEPEALLQRVDADSFALAPWEPGFTLATEEAITDADGRFELATTRADGSRLLVVAPDWRRKELKQPKLGAGDRADGLEVRLPVETQLFLEVREEGGAPLKVSRRLDSGWLLEVRAVLRDGREWHVRLHDAGDSTFGVSFAAAPEETTSLILRTAEHRGVTLALPAPPRDRPTFRVELARRREFLLELDVKVADPTELEWLAGTGLSLGALKLPLVEAEAAAAMGDDALMRLIGVVDFGVLNEQRQRITLRLPSGGAWHVVAVGPWGESTRVHQPVELGTFVPDGTPHEVVLPPASAAWRARIAALKAKPPTDAKPGRGGRVLARFVEAASGKPIAPKSFEGPAFWVDQDFERPIRWSRSSEASAPFAASLMPGEWRVDFAFEGYRPAGSRMVTVASEAVVDLGTIALEALPQRLARLVERSGGTAASGWNVALFDAADEPARASPLARGTTDTNGIVTLRCDPPPRVRLQAEAPKDASSVVTTGRFELALDAWPAGETAAIELPPRCDLEFELDLVAVDPDLLDERWQMVVLAADSPADGPGRPLALGHARDADSAASQPLRRFAIRLFPGRWRLRARSALHLAEDALVEIAADGTTAESIVRRSARPR